MTRTASAVGMALLLVCLGGLPLADAATPRLLDAAAVECAGQVARIRTDASLALGGRVHAAELCAGAIDLEVIAPRIMLEPGSQLVTPDGTGPAPSSLICGDITLAVGADGSRGGNIHIVTASIEASGIIRLGNGGDGEVVTLAAYQDCHHAEAHGGNGGASGRLFLNGQPLARLSDARIEGGLGGGGGAARVVAAENHTVTDSLDGNTTEANGANGTVERPDGEDAHASAPNGGPPVRTGGDGWKALARGGHGGPGALRGGSGGTAEAWGGNGTSPANVTDASQWTGNPSRPRGGHGGKASASGGYGGTGPEGGRGGDAFAYSGSGGRGPSLLLPPNATLDESAGHGGHAGVARARGGIGGTGTTFGGHGGNAHAESGRPGRGGDAPFPGGTGGDAGHLLTAEALGGDGGQVPGFAIEARGGNGGNATAIHAAMARPGAGCFDGGNMGAVWNVEATGGAGGAGLVGGNGGAGDASAGPRTGDGERLKCAEPATTPTASPASHDTPGPTSLAVAVGLLAATVVRGAQAQRRGRR